MTRHHRSGLTLIEVLVALLVIGIVSAGVLPVVWSSLRTGSMMREKVRARALAMELYEEIISYQEQRSFRGGDERAHLLSEETSRSTFQSALDYNGLRESPPLDPLGNPIDGYERYGRSVRVRFVDPAAPDKDVASGSFHLIEITVTVEKDGKACETICFLKAIP